MFSNLTVLSHPLIQHKLTIDDISRLDMIYAPPFAPLWDPILIAANQAKKKLK